MCVVRPRAHPDGRPDRQRPSRGVRGLLTCPQCPCVPIICQPQGPWAMLAPARRWGGNRVPTRPRAPPMRLPIGGHRGMCPFGRCWSFRLLLLRDDREVTSLSCPASLEATAERKAYLAQAFLQNNLWCRVYMLVVDRSGPRHRRRQQHTEQPSRCISAPANSSRTFVMTPPSPRDSFTRRVDLQRT